MRYFFLSDFAIRASCNMLPERLISHGLNAQNSRHFATPSDWFPGEMTSKQRAQKLHTADTSLPRSG